MLGRFPAQADVNPATLILWFKEVVLCPEDRPHTEVQVRLRGNILHVLCESARADLSKERILMRLVRSLMESAVQTRLEREFPQIYQIYIYCRRALDAKPIWSAPIYLNRLDRHLARLTEPAATTKKAPKVPPVRLPAVSSSSVSAAQVLEMKLAHQGDSEAIARYLSESLSALKVGVKVSARVIPGKARRAKAVMAVQPSDAPAKSLVSRLWVFCEASYSPDPLLIAEPIAERLRRLHLRQFQDAVITIQVTGEAASDWRLRVDLTPPEDMLRDWARWADLSALSRLVNQISRRYGLKLVAETRKTTLHLISYPLSSTGGHSVSQAVDCEALVTAISELLTAIAPQGLQQAMLYGPSTDDISPEWMRSLDLPAAKKPALAETTAALAARGEMPALAYCLTRALNPSLKDQLATGGIRVQLLIKDKLLHVMADGPVCPPKHAIVPLVSQTLAPLRASGLVEGIRLYGRRAGQKQPMWTHGHDYQPRQRLVPEAKPEFAASEAYIGELITPVSDESLAVTLPQADEADTPLGQVVVSALQSLLLKSQAFTLAEAADDLRGLSANLPRAFRSGGKMALLWGALGVLLAFQVDFMVGRALNQAEQPQRTPDSDGMTSASPSAASEEDPDQASQSVDDELARLQWGRGQTLGGQAAEESFASRTEDDRFADGDFTASAIQDDALIYSPQQELVPITTLLADNEQPSFRSQQLDEKLALYRRQVARSGPPDVLVIGSSRALRGVDPAALRQSLGAVGHEGLSVFNFGVNGATAQVVDLVVRQLIPPDQLPQIIVWADGARAFNSGRIDVTFNAITVSEGYQQMEASRLVDSAPEIALSSLAEQLTRLTQALDREISERLGQVSAGYSDSSKIRSAIGQGFGAIAPDASEGESTRTGDTPTGLPTETSMIDFDGFLALSTRFNPATYYQDHARVAGAYDGDYEAFHLQGKQTEALDRLLAFVTEKSVPVIFINTPLTDDYLDSHRDKAETEFRHYMVRQADSAEIMIFRDLGRLWPQRYDYFSDPSHLNRYGAYQVSTRLAQDPLIPWPNVLPADDQPDESD
ncbi:MAG: hypothetical protein WBB01_15845 [Phormidesmis sp.]